MECEEFILPDWSPPDNPIQSERASSSLMECEKFILPDWSPPNDPTRVLAAEGRRNPSDDNENDDDDHPIAVHDGVEPVCNGQHCAVRELFPGDGQHYYGLL